MAVKKNRTFMLVALLDAAESKAFEKELVLHKRDSLLPLHKILRKLARKELPLEKQQVYEALYKTPYSADKDYLLRNELRLLGEVLTAFVAQNTIQKQLLENPAVQQKYFLNWLATKPAFELYEAEAQAALAAQTNDAGSAAHTLRGYIEAYIQNREATVANYEALIAHMKQYYELETQHYLQNLIGIKHKQAFAERTLQAVTGGQYVVSQLEDIELNWEQASDSYLSYMVLLTQSYGNSGKEKIARLLEAREYLNQIDKKDFDLASAQSSLFAGIALEYFLLGEFDGSVKWHQEALKSAKNIAPEKLITYVFNYLSTLIRLADYTKAIEIMEQHRGTWMALPRMRDRFRCMLAMCHIFNQNHEAAWECIPIDRKQGGTDHYYYYRTIHIIVLLRREYYDMAEAETDNFIHAIRYNDKDAGYLKFLQILKKYIKVVSEKQSVTPSVHEERIAEVGVQLAKHEHIIDQPDKALIFRWLKEEL